MAAKTTNDGQAMRFEAGGILTLNNGTDTYTLKNIEPGTVEFADGGYEILNYTDRGVQQTPLLGDDKRSMLKFSMKLAKTTSGETITDIGNSFNSTTGTAQMFTAIVTIPYYKGATTGLTYTYANTYFLAPPRVRSGGAGFDIVEFEMESLTKIGTEAAY